MARMVRTVMFFAVSCVAASEMCVRTAKMEEEQVMGAPCGNIMDRGDGKGRCAENFEWLGHGSNCPDHDGTDQATCEADSTKGGFPFDSSKGKCYWLGPIADDAAARKAVCESATRCEFTDGNCQETAASQAKKKQWEDGKGLGCGARVGTGCVDNSDYRSRNDLCAKQDETACLAVDKAAAPEGHCNTGVCSGTATNGLETCTEPHSEDSCTKTPGCTWKSQCCQWLGGLSTDFATMCLNGPEGKEATIAGLCEVKRDWDTCIRTCPTLSTAKFPEDFFDDNADVEENLKTIQDNAGVKATIKCFCEKCGDFNELKVWPSNKGGAACKAAGNEVASASRSPLLVPGIALVFGMAILT